VLDVLRDLRRRFQVDSDRVFLTGFGEGATMAFDVGLSHPDLFAGVVPVAGEIQRFSVRCLRNGKYLPLYIVASERQFSDAQEGRKDMRRYMEDCINHGYPVIYVEYPGRGVETFEGEIPNIFDWMGRKKRAHPVTELGRNGNGSNTLGDEFLTLRQTDNRFYWLGTDAVDPHHVMKERWDPRITPAMLDARNIDNQINVNAYGVNQVSVWLTPEMVDFKRPLTVRINVRAPWIHKVTPSLETLLEDLHLRGDRQQLYVARVDFAL